VVKFTSNAKSTAAGNGTLLCRLLGEIAQEGRDLVPLDNNADVNTQSDGYGE